MFATVAPQAVRPLKRRPWTAWFQFRLRTFFLAFTVVAVLLGGSISYEQNRCRKGQAAAKALQEARASTLGMSSLASASYFYLTWQFPSPISLDKDPKHEPRPRWLRDILGDNSFEAVCGMWLRERDASDANLAHVGRLTGIKELRLVGGTFTDEGLAHLQGLKELESLYINQKAVSDRGIGQLAKLPRLKKLELHSTSVTGSGLVGFAKLEELEISDSPLTDEGRAAIGRIRTLKKVDLGSPK
jgi:hypothetical protein